MLWHCQRMKIVVVIKVLSLHHDISTSSGEEVIVFTLAHSPDFREVKNK